MFRYSLMVILIIELEILELLSVLLVKYPTIILVSFLLMFLLFCVAVIWDHDTNDWMVNIHSCLSRSTRLSNLTISSSLKTLQVSKLIGSMATFQTGLPKLAPPPPVVYPWNMTFKRSQLMLLSRTYLHSK